MLRDGRVTSSWGAILAPALLGACVAVAVPSTKTVAEAPEVVHDAPAPPNDAAAPWVEGEKTGAEFSADPPGKPLPGVVEGLAPKIHAGTFTRKVDCAQLEARGAARLKAGLHAAALRGAVAFDNEAWTGGPRRELLAYLRGVAVEGDARFTSADARIVAQLQAGSGARADGELRDETMAVLFATGFRFSPRKATASDVRLEFYPGEVEDLDAWNREIDQKVTKDGGGFRDVNAPPGEGTIYVYVGGSIVASYRARGGPPSPLDDDGEHIAVPTKPGVYRLGAAHAHVTSNWYYSQIPWGAEYPQDRRRVPVSVARALRVVVGDGQPGRQAQAAARQRGLPGAARSDPRRRDRLALEQERLRADCLEPRPERHVCPHDAGGGAGGDAAPGAETSLRVSHGCVHIYPRDRDEMMKWGYLGTNIPFVVRRWDEHLLPDQIRHEMLGPQEHRVKS